MHDGTPEPVRKRRPRFGKRRRRITRASLLLLAAGILAAAVGVFAYRASRPEVRRPGEALDEVTSRLERELPPGAPMPRFTDVTSGAGLGVFRTFLGNRTSQLPEDMGPGAAWGDFDSDGDQDLFLVSAGGPLDAPHGELGPSGLYENLGDGSFRPLAGFAQLRLHGMAAAWGDADNDGRLDLVLTGYDSLILLRNREDGFQRDEEFPEPPGFWAGAAWGDFDLDGDLDLYVTGYVRYRPVDPQSEDSRRSSQEYGTVVPYTLNPASYPPERNLLFHNRGDGTFVEVAASLGVANVEGRSLGALWHDWDDDGRLDLYVANDISDNALFLNRPDGFVDAGLAAWVADYRGAMGLAAGDWNRDGDDDLFVTHWVSQENALYDSLLVDLAAAAAATPAGDQEGGRGQLHFSDVAAGLGVGQIALPYVGWGTEFADFDGDGWLDLVVANGSTFETEEQPKRLKPEAPFLFWNERGRYFHDLAPRVKPLSEPRVGRGLALADYDNDGDQDVLIVTLDGGVRLLRNDMQTGNWVSLSLRRRAGEGWTEDVGSSVVAEVGDTVLRRSTTTSSYLSQSSRVLHFGLGEARRIDRLEVRWLGGEVEVFENLEANTAWEISQGRGVPRRIGGETASAGDREDERQRVQAFWSKQRAAMDALKLAADCDRAIPLLRDALALSPTHQDSRYYLANCLAEVGQDEAALVELETLRRQNPESHRAHRQWGVLRAMTARGPGDLEAATAALERSLALNREETGSLLVLGELALLQGQDRQAARRLEQACRSNPKAVGGFFLRSYLAWKEGRVEESRKLLQRAREAQGEGWKPTGAAAEGDVRRRMHQELTPLARFWRSWNGETDPQAAFAELEAHLQR